MIIGRLIPAGTGFNAYDQRQEWEGIDATLNNDLDYNEPLIGEDINPLSLDDSTDVIIDDQSARTMSPEP